MRNIKRAGQGIRTFATSCVMRTIDFILSPASDGYINKIEEFLFKMEQEGHLNKVRKYTAGNRKTKFSGWTFT